MSTLAKQPPQADAVLAALDGAPIVEGDPEEVAAFEEGVADIEAGRTVTAEDVRARLQNRAHE